MGVAGALALALALALATFTEREPIVQAHTRDVFGFPQHGLGPIVHATPDQDERARAGKRAEPPE